MRYTNKLRDNELLKLVSRLIKSLSNKSQHISLIFLPNFNDSIRCVLELPYKLGKVSSLWLSLTFLCLVEVTKMMFCNIKLLIIHFYEV